MKDAQEKITCRRPRHPPVGSAARRARPRASTAAASCAPRASPSAASRPRPARPPTRVEAAGTRGGCRGAKVEIKKSVCTHCSVGCTVIAEVENGVWTGQEPGFDSPLQSRRPLRQGRRHPRARARRAPPQVSDEARRRQMGAHELGPGHQRGRRQAAATSARSPARTASTGSAPPSTPTSSAT